MIDAKPIAFAAAAIATIAASGAAAETFVKYGEAGDWTVFTKTDDKTCVAETRHDDVIVQIGVLEGNEIGYIGAFTHDPDQVAGEEGNEFIIDIDGDLFVGDESMMAENSQGYTGVYIKSDNPAFVKDISEKQTMKVIDAERVYTLDLTGTKAALEMTGACLAAQG